MKVTTKFFMLALILSLMLTVSAVAAAEDISFDKSDTKNTNKNLLSTDDGKENLKTNDKTLNDETLSAKPDDNKLGDGQFTYSELRSQIGNGRNITLNKGTYTYTSGDGSTITITNSCTIDGNGSVIDMANSTNMRAFFVNANGVTIKNLTIKNANYAGLGGAIYFNQPGNVINCNFNNNNASSSGGAIFFQNNGTVTNCNFNGNTGWAGGAIFFNNNHGTVTNCNFNNNNASSSGGAIFFQNNGTVTNCNFNNNNASSSGGAIFFQNNGTVTNCNFNGNTGRAGGAIFFNDHGTVINCNFINNTAELYGGAIYFNDDNGNVINCNFTGNTARYNGAIHFQSTGTVTNCNFNGNTARYGGAIHFCSTGTVTNCNFNGNTATTGFGGAISFDSTGTVTNCNFNGNTATNGEGGAICFHRTGTVTNCNFNNNRASDRSGAIFSNKWFTTADTCIFKTSSDSTFNVVFRSPTLNVDNFTTFYGSGEKLTFDLKTNSSMTVDNGNISIEVYDENNVSIGNYSCLSGEGWIVNLPAGLYYAVYNTEYKGFQKINRTLTINKANSTLTINDNITFDYNSAGSTTVTFTNSSSIIASVVGHDEAIVNIVGNTITVSNLNPGEYTLSVTTITDGNYNNVTKTAMITVNKANSTLTINNITFDYGGSGSTIVNFTNAIGINASVVGQPNAIVNVVNNTITVSGLDAGTYTLNVTTIVDDNHNPVTQTATITVNKIKTELTADAITTTYNVNKYLVITLKDVNGNPLKGVSISVDLNGVKKYTTDSNGQVKVSTKGLAPKTYTAKITFNGNDIYDKSAKNLKVTVKKLASKITAGKKTFKAKTKVKKYVAVLKDSTGKAIKNAKLTLKVKGKTYAAKTNSKGKAIFKITKLNKKGTFKGVIKFNGNTYYTKSSKNVKITVKASKSKTTFKTVSKGSKDKKTVKKIQQALKDHGYYLTYKGHYLKVDGKFESCTERSVKQFQSDHGLKVTGKVDAKTAKKLGII